MAASFYSVAKVLVDAYDLTAFLKKVNMSREREVLDMTTLASGRAREHMPGLKSGAVSAEGLHDGVVLGIDEILNAALGGGAAKNVTIIDANAVGGDCHLCLANETKFAVSLQPGSITQANAEFTASDGIDAGVVLHAAGAETATGNGASVDNAAATTNGGVAHLHASAATGTTPSAAIKIQHSVDGSTWVDLVTFAAVTATVAQRVEVTGTVNRYLRAIRTITGTTPSITYAVAFARR